MDVSLSPARGWLLSLLVAAFTFAAISPTLGWQQFTGGNENIVTETALEMRRGGPKLVPEMLGEPRIAKPPMVAWITALAMRPATLARLDSENPASREQAYIDLSWQVRWTGLLAGCLLILATHAFGSAIGGPGLGVASAVVIASSLLFQKFARQSTTDIHLAFWVVAADACFAQAILHGRRWRGIVGGSLAVAIAFLCKGPVALVQTVLPAVLFAWAYTSGDSPLVVATPASRSPAGEIVLGAAPRPRRRRGHYSKGSIVSPLFVGALLFFAIALPWFVYVLSTVPGAGARWWMEVRREGATDLEASPPWKYVMLFPYVVPWLTFAIVGLLMAWPAAWTDALRGRRPGWKSLVTTRQPLHCATLSIFVPLLVMSFFRDRKDRYMMPFLGPLAVVAGYGVLMYLRTPGRERRLLSVLHWGTVALIGVAAAVAGSSGVLRTTSGEPWFTREIAGWTIAATVMLVACGALLARTRSWPLPAFTLAAMLGIQALFVHGYALSPSGRSTYKPLADTIHANFPDADVYDWVDDPDRKMIKRVDGDIAIYLPTTVRRQRSETISPSDRPVVLLTRQRPQDAEPIPPPGWISFAKTPPSNSRWWAFVRVGNGATQ